MTTRDIFSTFLETYPAFICSHLYLLLNANNDHIVAIVCPTIKGESIKIGNFWLEDEYIRILYWYNLEETDKLFDLKDPNFQNVFLEYLEEIVESHRYFYFDALDNYEAVILWPDPVIRAEKRLDFKDNYSKYLMLMRDYVGVYHRDLIPVV